MSLDMGVRNPEFVEEIPSPFIPGTDHQFAWDSTSLEYGKRCWQLYKYTMIDGYVSKRESVHLRFGGEFHQSMADYKKLRVKGIHHDTAVFEVVKALMHRIKDFWPDDKYKSRTNLLKAVIGYVDEHQDDPAESIVLPTGEAAVEYSFRLELDYMATEDQPYILCGHMDEVVKFSGDYFVRDYKTTTSTPTPYYWQQFEPNNQMTLYTFASRVVLSKPAKGVIIDSIQLFANDKPRFTRGLTYRTEAQLEEWVYELEFVFDQAEQHARVGVWPKNDTACNMYGGCPFRHVCSSDPGIRDAILESDFEKRERWNPLKPR
jgi:hypothetical protein